jgi:hypothetical protein
MGRVEKTVFISHRRTNFPWALATFQDLTQHDYDVLFDFLGTDWEPLPTTRNISVLGVVCIVATNPRSKR